MRIIIENTEKIVNLNGLPARVWEGITDGGIEVHCFITLVSPQTTDSSLLVEFEEELKEVRAPSPSVVAYPLSIIL
jgi:hypothetical protein